MRVPSGVTADAFYQKGCGVRSLLKIIEGLSQQNWPPATPLTNAALFWIQRNGNDDSGESCVSITCPDCLRTFQQTVDGALSPIREAYCVHCGNTVYYSIVEPVDWSPQTDTSKTSSRGKACRPAPVAILINKKVVPMRNRGPRTKSGQYCTVAFFTSPTSR